MLVTAGSETAKWANLFDILVLEYTCAPCTPIYAYDFPSCSLGEEGDRPLMTPF